MVASVEYPFLKGVLDFRLPSLARRTCISKYLLSADCVPSTDLESVTLEELRCAMGLGEPRAFAYALPGFCFSLSFLSFISIPRDSQFARDCSWVKKKKALVLIS